MELKKMTLGQTVVVVTAAQDWDPKKVTTIIQERAKEEYKRRKGKWDDGSPIELESPKEIMQWINKEAKDIKRALGEDLNKIPKNHRMRGVTGKYTWDHQIAWELINNFGVGIKP